MMKNESKDWDSFRQSIGMKLVDGIDLMTSVLEAKSAEALHVSLEKAARKCGFNTFVSGVQMVAADGSVQHNLISAYPVTWQALYADRGYIWTDPTVIHCQNSLVPLVWDEQFFRRNNGRDMWEEAKFYGVSHGISVALHDMSGSKSMLSLVRDQEITQDEQDGRGIIAAARVIASCAHFASLRIAEAAIRPERDAHLTPQEVECLKWASAGKTSKEMGKILAIAEPTVVFHLKNAMHKLGASNRTQTLAIAIRLGYIN